MLEDKIAYFSMEIGIDERIPTYSGGLGVLAGDTIKSAADLNVPMVGVTLLSKKGYFYQTLDEHGMQKELPVNWRPDDFLKKLDTKVTIVLEGRKIAIQAWVFEVKGMGGSSVNVYFLDTALPENDVHDMEITSFLYGGDSRYRLLQEAVLGIGGVRMLEALGHKIRKYHMNEGHSAFLTLELSKRDDIESIREKCVFTTHTPVAAGHDQFEITLAKGILGDYWNPELEKDVVHEGKLNMTLLALHFSTFVNGVAKRHSEVSRSMFPGVHIDSITNGIHSFTWASPSMKSLFDKYIPGWANDPFSLRYMAGSDKTDVWNAHLESKRKMINYVSERTNAGMDHDIFTIVFARRMTAYKRPLLLFQDMARLLSIAERYHIQIVIAGKAHPRDLEGRELIKRIHGLIHELKGRINIAFIENYDIYVGKLMVSGADIWLNTPLRPREASGTSGMKAALNGVPSLSVLDGWWIEGHIENITGWSIGPKPAEREMEDNSGNDKDASDMYEKLEKVILPLYYDDWDNWMRKMRSAIALNASFFNTHRMVQQYITNACFR